MINLTAALATGLKEANKKDEWNTSKLHASDTSVYIDGSDGKCEKQLWLRYHNKPKEEHGAGTLLMFEQGNNLEDMAVKYLRKGLPKGYHIVGTQINISSGLPDNMNGTLDILISDGTDYAVIDVKSQRGASFRYMNDTPKPMHRMQVNTYAWALEKMWNVDVKSGAILVLDREGQNFAEEFWWNITTDDLVEIKAAIDYISEIVTLPQEPTTLDPKVKINKNKGDDSVKISLPWQCKYCDYRGVSCKGAIPPEFDDNLGKVCGHITDDGFVEKCDGIAKYIVEVL